MRNTVLDRSCEKYSTVLQRVKEGRNALHRIQQRKTNFLYRNCLLKRIIQGKIERRRGTKARARKKTSAATGWPIREQKIMELEGRNARSLSIEISIWKRPLTCQKPGYVMTK